MKKLVLAVVTTASLALPGIALADVSGVEAAAAGFSTQFVSSAAVIGGAMITAAFGAIVWKWIKGMIFS